MIKLTKGQKPDVLKRQADNWTREYLSARERGNAANGPCRFRYRDSEIKEALRRECCDKCAYCESKISHVFPGETDHIAPVSERPDLIVDWGNLAYVCKECNRSKGSYYSEEEPLINPYIDDPSNHLRFYGPVVFQAPGDVKGFRTRRVLDLARMSLFERRKEKIERLQTMIDSWSSQPQGPTRELLKTEVLSELQTDKEYSAAARAFVFQSTGLQL